MRYSLCIVRYNRIIDDIIMRTPEDYKKKDIEVIIEVEVIAVDSDKKTVTYEQDGNEIVMDYDKLVFTTGGNPFVPPMQKFTEVFPSLSLSSIVTAQLNNNTLRLTLQKVLDITIHLTGGLAYMVSQAGGME